MKNSKLNEFAKMLNEELKKTSTDKQMEVAPAEPTQNSLQVFAEMMKNELDKTKKPEKTLAEQVSEYVSKTQPINESIPVDHANLVAKSIINDNVPAKPSDIEKQRWNDPLTKDFVTHDQMKEHYSLFLKRIQQQMSTMGGSGEVNFRYLDDTNRATMTPNNDNWVLEYDSNTKKVQFTNEIGPIAHVAFDINHETSDEVTGTICWDKSDQTLNLFHPNGVVQQIGQELYAYIRNGTANTIVNGTAVQFAGAEQNGTARLLIAPMIADGSQPSLYGLGIATEDIQPGEDGRVTVWGKVRDLNLSAFNIGDILYISPTDAGALTNIKPTAPNNVIPIAAVLNNTSDAGELFVRPTVEQQQYYGRFARTTNQTANTVNTGYPVQFNDTEISNGITIGTPTSRLIVSESGFYQFDTSIQITATSNKGIVFSWYRKNGVDIPYSSRRTTVTNGDTFTLHTSLQVSLDANDYIEIVWAATAAGIFLDANATPAIGPAVASVLVSVGQIQL